MAKRLGRALQPDDFPIGWHDAARRAGVLKGSWVIEHVQRDDKVAVLEIQRRARHFIKLLHELPAHPTSQAAFADGFELKTASKQLFDGTWYVSIYKTSRPVGLTDLLGSMLDEVLSSTSDPLTR
jgi:hypothetical protein